MLSEPPMGDWSRFSLKIYLFGTRKYLDLVISKQHTVEEVIKHVISVCMTTAELKRQFFDSAFTSRAYLNSELYELRLLDDDDEDEYYLPLYDIAPLHRSKCIGDFGADALALCRARGVTFSFPLLPGSDMRNSLNPTHVRGIELKIHYVVGQKESIFHVNVPPEKQLRDVLKEISKLCGEDIKEGLYAFETYNPFRKPHTVSLVFCC